MLDTVLDNLMADVDRARNQRDILIRFIQTLGYTEGEMRAHADVNLCDIDGELWRMILGERLER